ncbi:2-keto-4-pentenoate hydratase [Methylobacterium trifolii]|uniref:2-hydroxyhexa-2,4-dienoate hydratase n=1 Tax=Methylobacterium trifolii TaxID=1003092 RepID=A0ABQ4U3D5_9HYPH|nr:hydratase [Methylobacterium trifolii]GJE61781.1 2-hydroxyhexa-2,4-dienoate hydratase [Methylobacterium trifolii]
MREARGERVVGRKIGFTNHRMWAEYGVRAPIWGYVYDTTLGDLDGGGAFDPGGLAEPRIEPEIVFGLARAPRSGMDERALMDCLGWVAPGFELVQSLYPGWRFRAADTVAAFALHGRLLVGERTALTLESAASWHARLADFAVTLLRDGAVADRGVAENVLGGGPVSALRHLVEVLAQDSGSPPLAAGEVVSTGTLTRALPIGPGERWAAAFQGLPLPGIALST